MYVPHDPDEYEAIIHQRVCTACGGDLRKCTGACNGMSGYSLVKRPAAEVAKIKAERRQKHEAAVIAEADAIRARQS